jgi:hypothetical protein
MNTIVVWLLISAASSVTLVDRFPSEEECQKVATVVKARYYGTALTCAKATIIAPSGAYSASTGNRKE